MDLETLKQQARRFHEALPHPQAALTPLLILLMKSENHVSDEMQSALAQVCEVPLEHVKELYASVQPSSPVNLSAVRICRDLICELNGAAKVCDLLRSSGKNGSQVEFISCPGYCHVAPVVQSSSGVFCRAVFNAAPKDESLALGLPAEM